jgi:sulfur-oxidizing protein SoxZ
MADPMKIRATVKDGVADVRALIAHEMETGQRKDSAGKLVSAWHITDLVASLNGKAVLKAHWGAAISKNPLISLKIKGAKIGDTVSLSWVDNKGDKRSDEVKVA